MSSSPVQPRKHSAAERALRRLLTALEPVDARAKPGALDPDTIIVCAAARGVTIVRHFARRCRRSCRIPRARRLDAQ